MKHTDVLGQEVKVDDIVLYGGGKGKYAGFKPSKVLKLTEKRIRIEFHNGVYSSEQIYVNPKDCVVIDKLLES